MPLSANELFMSNNTPLKISPVEMAIRLVKKACLDAGLGGLVAFVGIEVSDGELKIKLREFEGHEVQHAVFVEKLQNIPGATIEGDTVTIKNGKIKQQPENVQGADARLSKDAALIKQINEKGFPVTSL